MLLPEDFSIYGERTREIIFGSLLIAAIEGDHTELSE